MHALDCGSQVLDALTWIKNKVDSTLVFRRHRSGMVMFNLQKDVWCIHLLRHSTRKSVMTESRQQPQLPSRSEPAMGFSDNNTFLVDAVLIGELLHIPPPRVPELMREGQITSGCERGVGEHEGEFRLTFFYRNRRARLGADPTGRILRKSVIDFGDRPVPAALRRAGN